MILQWPIAFVVGALFFCFQMHNRPAFHSCLFSARFRINELILNETMRFTQPQNSNQFVKCSSRIKNKNTKSHSQAFSLCMVFVVRIKIRTQFSKSITCSEQLLCEVQSQTTS